MSMFVDNGTKGRKHKSEYKGSIKFEYTILFCFNQTIVKSMLINYLEIFE